MTLTTTHIEELLDKCRLGDQRAQMVIYNKYYKAMYNTSLRIVKHEAEAEDIMQESFLKAFTRLDSFQGTSTFGAWLKKIVVNRSINAYNKSSRFQEVSYTDQLKYAEDDAIGIDQQEEHQNPKVRKLLNAMDDLKENYRIALTLHLIEGYDHEEICEILELDMSQVKVNLFRARNTVREKITKIDAYGL